MSQSVLVFTAYVTPASPPVSLPERNSVVTSPLFSFPVDQGIISFDKSWESECKDEEEGINDESRISRLEN